ncbi:MAG: Flp/Fap pilin component [Chloroflexota bacterium]|jgi:pilus assembly protein Flp/PilA
MGLLDRLLSGLRHLRTERHRGQGLVEYGLVLVLIAIVVVGGVTMVGKQTNDRFVEVECRLDGGAYHQDSGQGNSDKCVGRKTNNGNGGNGGNGGGN